MFAHISGWRNAEVFGVAFTLLDGLDCTLPDRSRIFVPITRAQRCGQLLEQVQKAVPAMDLRGVLKYWAVAMQMAEVLLFTVYKISIT